MNIRTLLPLLCVGLLLAGCATSPPPRRATHSTAPATITGVASCDAYLASYLACHRAAAIYPADQLQAHYQAMRDSLLHASQDPRVRPYLRARCLLLTQQMNQTLQGKACTATQQATPH